VEDEETEGVGECVPGAVERVVMGGGETRR
jgi:hypothetical protein